MNACSRDRSAASSSAPAWSRVSDCDGRPVRPCGVSTSAETFRRTRSLPLSVPHSPRQAVVRLLRRPGGMRRRHLRQRHPHVLHSQVLQRDRPDNREQRAQRVPVNFDRLGSTVRQTLGQPVGNSLLNRVPVHSPHAGVEFGVHFFELVPNLSLGLAADLPPNPLAVR
jgi:hypothetical protein